MAFRCPLSGLVPKAATVLMVLSGVVSAAIAECPTRDALAAGQRAYVTYPDGSIVDLKWLGEGMVQETTRYDDGIDEFRMISMGGVFIVDSVDMDGAKELSRTRISTRYPDDMMDRLPLEPGQVFDVVAVNRFADGAEPEREYLSVHTGITKEIGIAGCTYKAFPVVIRYRWQDGMFTSMLSHLPDLGVSIEVIRMDEGEAPQAFTPQSFSLTAP